MVIQPLHSQVSPLMDAQQGSRTQVQKLMAAAKLINQRRDQQRLQKEQEQQPAKPAPQTKPPPP